MKWRENAVNIGVIMPITAELLRLQEIYDAFNP